MQKGREEREWMGGRKEERDPGWKEEGRKICDINSHIT